jgi:hypothetical protein
MDEQRAQYLLLASRRHPEVTGSASGGPFQDTVPDLAAGFPRRRGSLLQWSYLAQLAMLLLKAGQAFLPFRSMSTKQLMSDRSPAGNERKPLIEKYPINMLIRFRSLPIKPKADRKCETMLQTPTPRRRRSLEGPILFRRPPGGRSAHRSCWS